MSNCHCRSVAGTTPVMTSSVPTIDFTNGRNVPHDKYCDWNPTDEEKALGAQIIHAFQTVGFVCLTNTELSEEQVCRPGFQAISH